MFDIQNSRVGRFLLSSGKEVIADECIFDSPIGNFKDLPRAALLKKLFGRGSHRLNLPTGSFLFWSD